MIAIVVHERMKLGDNTPNNERLSLVNTKGQFFKRSLASVQQNRVLSHFQFICTIYREQFHESMWLRLEKHLSS